MSHPLRTIPTARALETVLMFEAEHGSERVAGEIVSHLERRAEQPRLVDGDQLLMFVNALGLLRDRMPPNPRHRLDARIRVLLATRVPSPDQATLASWLARVVNPTTEKPATTSKPKRGKKRR